MCQMTEAYLCGKVDKPELEFEFLNFKFSKNKWHYFSDNFFIIFFCTS